MCNEYYGGRCGRCGKEFKSYEPTTLCWGCTVERAINRSKVWRCPVKRKNRGVKR